MSVTEINKKIIHDIELSKKRAKREMTKNGFVNAYAVPFAIETNVSTCASIITVHLLFVSCLNS